MTMTYMDRLRRLEQEAIGKPCATCGRAIRRPWVAYVPVRTSLAGERLPEWSAAYCSHECGGSFFTP